MADPRVIAAGRASEILDLGDGRLLRRFKGHGDPAQEALVMRHARDCGYPVPQVFEVAADSLVIERIDGPTMQEALYASAGTLEEHARVLARLHDELHRIAAPAGLPALGDGDRLLHLDLHPANVILSPAGPVVIDWTNARAGAALLDIAYTWVICATSDGGDAAARFTELFLALRLGGAAPAPAARRRAPDRRSERPRRGTRAGSCASGACRRPLTPRTS